MGRGRRQDGSLLIIGLFAACILISGALGLALRFLCGWAYGDACVAATTEAGSRFKNFARASDALARGLGLRTGEDLRGLADAAGVAIREHLVSHAADADGTSLFLDIVTVVALPVTFCKSLVWAFIGPPLGDCILLEIQDETPRS